MKEQTIPILLNLIAAAFGAFGQYAYKKGALQIKEVPIYLNFSIGMGVLLFCGVMVFFIIGYRLGGRISVVYPFYATTFIWAGLISYFFEGEPLKLSFYGGTVLIITGLIWIAQGIEVA